MFTDLDHLTRNLKAWLRADYLQDSGPTEWNSKTSFHPMQLFTFQSREESRLLLNFQT